MKKQYADFQDELARGVLLNRYFWKDENGDPIEGWDDMCMRVATAVASAEEDSSDRTLYNEAFHSMMVNGDFLPNSPVLMNFGLPNALGSACFVLPIDDDMDSIFDTLKNTAKIHKDGGGTGFNFSRLRPVGAKVKAHGKSSGVVSFMSIYNAAGMVIEQGGKRRGANMGMLNIDHPEIIKFIRCKEEDGQLSNFNISIAITDEFMKNVSKCPEMIMICRHKKTGDCWLDNNGGWHQVSSEGLPASAVRVGELFDMIVEHAWKNGEPGVFFIDRANEKNPVPHLGVIETTNPCGEYAAIPYSSCNLGSINLSNFAKDRAIQFAQLERTVRLAVRFLDNVIDVNSYPTPEIDRIARSTRPLGLGVMGFADMLLKLGVRYGSIESVVIARRVMSFINDKAHEQSLELAMERGSYLEAMAGGSMERNCQVTTIAPTGTISIIAGCSSGIEPVFSWGYNRKAAGNTVEVEHKIMREWMDDRPGDPVPDYFITAEEVYPSEHIEIQSSFQENCDNGVSKTINMSSGATKEDVASAIKMTWEMKCNGITVYRDGSRSNQVIETKKDEPETITLPEPVTEEELVSQRGVIVDRPRVTDGSTGRYKVGCGSLYITYNHLNGVPCEVFVNSAEGGGCAANSKALGMLISLNLRAGVEPDEVMRTLRKVSCPACRGKKGLDGKSCADVVARAMEEMAPNQGDFYEDFVPITNMQNEGLQESVCLSLGVALEDDSKYRCPDCGWPISHESGCVVCHYCGYSKCS